MIRFVLILALLLPSATFAAAPSISVAVSKPATCPAPCSVFFDATATTGGGTLPLHDNYYIWSFGDSGAGGYTYGNKAGSSKNMATGFVAAHVYENAGTYTWQLQVCNSATSCSTTSNTVTVTDPDTHWSTTKTICISTGTDMTGCPTGATQRTNVSPTGLVAQVAADMAADRRILLRRGDTFTITGPVIVNATGPGMLGAYGSGDRPIITTDTNSSTMIRLNTGCGDGAVTTLSNWRITDLQLISTGTGITGIDFAATMSQVLIHNVKTVDIDAAVLIDANNLTSCSPTADSTDQVTISEHHHSKVAYNGAIFFGMVSRFVLIDSYGWDSTDVEFMFRSMWLSKAFISGNTLGMPSTTKLVITMRTPNWDTGSWNIPLNTYTESIVVSDNYFVSNTDNVGVVKFGSVDFIGKIRNIIAERNWSNAALGTAATQEVWNIQGGDASNPVSIRNNLMDFGANTAAGKNCVDIAGTSGALQITDGALIYNNTCYMSGTGTNGRFAIVRAGATNNVIKNNLLYAPNVTTADTVSDSGTATTDSNNSPDPAGTCDAKDDPGFDNVSSAPSGFRIGESSCAVNLGADLFPSLYRDFYVCGPAAGVTNKPIGAFQPAANAQCRRPG